MQTYLWVTFFQFYVTNFNLGKVKGYVHFGGGVGQNALLASFSVGSAFLPAFIGASVQFLGLYGGFSALK